MGDKEIARLLRLAPAAKSLHHACLGGLLEHVVSLCTLSELITVRYFWLDRDLLIAGAILHDIGKIYELTYTRAFGYTTEGVLIATSTSVWPCCSRRRDASPSCRRKP